MDNIYNYIVAGILVELNKISHQCQEGKMEIGIAQMKCNKIKNDIVVHINRNLRLKKIIVHSYFEDNIYYMQINNDYIPIFKISD